MQKSTLQMAEVDQSIVKADLEPSQANYEFEGDEGVQSRLLATGQSFDQQQSLRRPQHDSVRPERGGLDVTPERVPFENQNINPSFNTIQPSKSAMAFQNIRGFIERSKQPNKYLLEKHPEKSTKTDKTLNTPDGDSAEAQIDTAMERSTRAARALVARAQGAKSKPMPEDEKVSDLPNN